MERWRQLYSGLCLANHLYKMVYGRYAVVISVLYSGELDPLGILVYV